MTKAKWSRARTHSRSPTGRSSVDRVSRRRHPTAPVSPCRLPPCSADHVAEDRNRYVREPTKIWIIAEQQGAANSNGRGSVQRIWSPEVERGSKTGSLFPDGGRNRNKLHFARCKEGAKGLFEEGVFLLERLHQRFEQGLIRC